MNLTSTHGNASSIPWPCSVCVGHRCGLDLVLLGLWCRPGAIVLIRPLVWETPYASGAALKKKRKKKKKALEEFPCGAVCSGPDGGHCCGSGYCNGAGLIPGPGTSSCHQCGKKKDKKEGRKKKKKRRKSLEKRGYSLEFNSGRDKKELRGLRSCGCSGSVKEATHLSYPIGGRTRCESCSSLFPQCFTVHDHLRGCILIYLETEPKA